jgi:hypothetical protein
MSFQVHALAKEPFQDYFRLDEARLAQKNARLETVTSKPGCPCRVSLADAEVGETVLLVHYEHQRQDTPYRASHAVYVRQNIEQAAPGIDEVPEMLASRLLSIRGFDKAHLMQSADVVDGAQVGETIADMFGDASIDYIHLHFAKPGCFAAKVTRA